MIPPSTPPPSVFEVGVIDRPIATGVAGSVVGSVTCAFAGWRASACPARLTVLSIVNVFEVGSNVNESR